MFVSRVPETLTLDYTVYDRSKRHPERHRQVPVLRMSGLWLEKYGFMPGDKVAVSVEQGVMTLRLVKQDKTKCSKCRK